MLPIQRESSIKHVFYFWFDTQLFLSIYLHVSNRQVIISQVLQGEVLRTPTMNNATEHRLIFLDNLRYFSVLCVVVLHSTCAYFYGAMAWWPVIDPAKTSTVNILAPFFDVFAMPLLFYIAGYFALPTMQKREWRHFSRAN